MLLIAILWGSTFFINKSLVGTIAPAKLTALRFSLSAIILVIIRPRALCMSHRTFTRGLIMGLAYGAGQLTTMFGLQWVPASISGFLTALYAIITTLGTVLILHQKPSSRIWLSIFAGLIALSVLLFVPGGDGGIGAPGVIMTLASAFFFATQILLTGETVTQSTIYSLTIMQTAATAALSFVIALPEGSIALPTDMTSWLVIAYLGVICGSLPIFLQSWGQLRLSSSQAALIMSSEPIWAALFAVLVGQEKLTARTVIGGIIMVLAIWLAVSSPKKSNLPCPQN